jgi:hypothetical protein
MQQLIAADGAFVVLLFAWEAWRTRIRGGARRERSIQIASGGHAHDSDAEP